MAKILQLGVDIRAGYFTFYALFLGIDVFTMKNACKVVRVHGLSC
jgi:hypothetical protein